MKLIHDIIHEKNWDDVRRCTVDRVYSRAIDPVWLVWDHTEQVQILRHVKGQLWFLGWTIGVDWSR